MGTATWTMRDEKTGEVRSDSYATDQPAELLAYNWTESTHCCDCNRAIMFYPGGTSDARQCFMLDGRSERFKLLALELDGRSVL